MGEKYLVIGAGMMGEAIAYDLLQSRSTSKVSIVDNNNTNARRVENRLDDDRVMIFHADASETEYLTKLMGEHNATINATSYEFNEALSKAAIEAGTHFCDLGGNNSVVEKQFLLDEEARTAKVKIVPDCGIAPGAVSILAALGIKEIGTPDYLHIRVGGLPQHPKGIFGYMKVFSVHGLINEYKEDTEVLRNYKIERRKSMSGIERITFNDSKIGKLEMEAAYTSGGSSTLTKTFKGRIGDLDYKTIRYPGHWKKMIFLEQLGFFDESKVINNTSPRQILERMIEKEISYKDEDMMLARVTLGKGGKELEYSVVDLQDKNHTAMQRTTGYSASIIAQMMIQGAIKEFGVLKSESSIPPMLFVHEWEKRGIRIFKKTH